MEMREYWLQNGKLQVQIFLTNASPETIAQLNALGFESTVKNVSTKILVGRIPVANLAALVRLMAVQFVSRSEFSATA